MIRLNHVFFAYQNSKRVISDIDFCVKNGEILVLAGANGSGKSTLLQLICGLFRPEKGEIEVGRYKNSPRRGDMISIRSISGLVFQSPDVQILGGTVGEDLMIGARGKGCEKEQIRARCMSLARRFDLESLWDTPVQFLSGGQQRRLCIASSLVGDVQILLFDEPLSGLDYPGIVKLRSILRDNKKAGLTQIVASHDLEPFVDIADNLALLKEGCLVGIGPPLEILPKAADAGVRPPCSWRISRRIDPWE